MFSHKYWKREDKKRRQKETRKNLVVILTKTKEQTRTDKNKKVKIKKRRHTQGIAVKRKGRKDRAAVDGFRHFDIRASLNIKFPNHSLQTIGCLS